MSDPEHAFQLAARNALGAQPVLQSVKASGRLAGMLFELTLRQAYRNLTDQPLEVVYTFPLPAEAHLMGFATELNSARMEGQVIPRKQANARYEAALDAGDAPVLLERAADGIHTVNIGNLKPGDEIVVEITYAQVLRFDQGRVRLAVPCTIAPRYGQPSDAGLQPQQAPTPSLCVDYPLQLTVQIDGELARGRIELPTHAFAVETLAEGVRLTLSPGARLDRDVVVAVTPAQERSSMALAAADPWNPAAPHVVMVAFQPPARKGNANCFVKLLVDCSGSMAGDSIASARRAVDGVIAGLRDGDTLSVSRFGATCETLLVPGEYSARQMRHARPALARLQADLGGTEMAKALETVFTLGGPASTGSGDVLLITDGEIWKADSVIASARESGQRVFIIGVGSSPAEPVLRRLADATGGACEFATPGEALEAAALRMLQRMRLGTWGPVSIDWGGETVWQSPTATQTYGGDTYLVCAGFKEGALPERVRLMVGGEDGALRELAQAQVSPLAANPTHLARIAARMRIGSIRQMAPIPTPAEKQDRVDHAVRYQLLTDETHYLLVHVRADGEKSLDAAQVHVVTPMRAAGHAGVGSVAARAPGETIFLARRSTVPRSASADGVDPRAEAVRQKILAAMNAKPFAMFGAAVPSEFSAPAPARGDAMHDPVSMPTETVTSTPAAPADAGTERTRQVLQKALTRRPHRIDWLLVLLEILAFMGKPREFEQWAQRLLARVGPDHPSWKRACTLGQKLDPANALYREVPQAVPEHQTAHS